MTTLSERALLTTLKVSQWTARRLDRGETTALNQRHGLKVEAARVNKNLLPFGTQLQQLQQVTGAVRKAFDAHTLPWSVDGMRILKSDAYLDFSKLARKWQDDWEEARDAFLDAYPTLEAEAAKVLGPLYDPADYPQGRDLERLFRFSIQFMPIADAKDWRIDVGDEAKRKLEQDIRAQLIEVEQTAMAEAWERVHEVVAKTVERLAEPTNIFRDSLVTNAIELCGMMPSLNLTNDPAMEATRVTIEQTLAKYAGNVDALRHDPIARNDAAEKLAEVMRKMGGYIPQRAA